jgi:RNA-directed DNA polymerase
VLRLIERRLKAGVLSEGQRLPTEQGTPQGGIGSPWLSNILLTPFDCEMRRRGLRLTRYADDGVIPCHTRAEAGRVLAEATRILHAPGVTLKVEKARIGHVTTGFEFLGSKIKRGSRPLKLAPGQIRPGRRQGDLDADPRAKSIEHFKDQIRQRTRRKSPVSTRELIAELDPVIRGWGQYFWKAHIRKRFARLDRGILRRIGSQRFKRWRRRGWKRLPERHLYGEWGLVRLIYLIPSWNRRR